MEEPEEPEEAALEEPADEPEPKTGKRKSKTKNHAGDTAVEKKSKRPLALTDAVGLEEPCDETPEETQEETQEETPAGKRKKSKKMVGVVTREGSSVRLRSKTSMDSLPDCENTTPARKTQKFTSPSASTTSSVPPTGFLVFEQGLYCDILTGFPAGFERLQVIV